LQVDCHRTLFRSHQTSAALEVSSGGVSALVVWFVQEQQEEVGAPPMVTGMGPAGTSHDSPRSVVQTPVSGQFGAESG